MTDDIKLRKFQPKDLPPVYDLVQNTIEVSYQGVYPEEAIAFFKEIHTRESIRNDATAGYTVVAEGNGEILATGTLLNAKLRRVFVSPNHQRRGISRLIVQELEEKAAREELASLELEASLNSKRFWELSGFTLRQEEAIPVGNGQELRFYRMTKTL